MKFVERTNDDVISDRMNSIMDFIDAVEHSDVELPTDLRQRAQVVIDRLDIKIVSLLDQLLASEELTELEALMRETDNE
jgi:uncharacterized phage-like protein YoqJ